MAQDILSKIVAHTQDLNSQRKATTPLQALQEQIAELGPTRSLTARLSEKRPHVIAEFKRKSPSKPRINLDAQPTQVATNYENGGASAMSVLTEPGFFAGSPDDLRAIRARVDLPLLRKDFMVDPYQFYEARAMGADLVLLIARILEPQQLAEYTALAHELGLEVLCEIHGPEELEIVGDAPVDLLGVNCRDLKHFTTNIDSLIHMVAELPKDKPLVAESGIHSKADLRRLYNAGYQLFLIGEFLMKSQDPSALLRDLIS